MRDGVGEYGTVYVSDVNGTPSFTGRGRRCPSRTRPAYGVPAVLEERHRIGRDAAVGALQHVEEAGLERRAANSTLS